MLAAMALHCLKGLTAPDWLVNGKASITSSSPNLDHNIDYIVDDVIVAYAYHPI